MPDPTRRSPFDFDGDAENIASVLARRLRDARINGRREPASFGLPDLTHLRPSPTAQPVAPVPEPAEPPRTETPAAEEPAPDVEVSAPEPPAAPDGPIDPGESFVLGRIAAVGSLGRESDLPTYLERHPESVFAKSLAAVVAKLSLGIEAGRNVVALSPLHCGEGATSVATCLAAAFGLAGKRVLVVDTDETFMGLSNLVRGVGRPGLAEVLDAQITANKALIDCSHFKVLPVGRAYLPSFADTSALQGFIAATKDRFDLILIDAPALMAGDGAIAVGRLADSYLMVVSCDKRLPQTFVSAVDTLADLPNFGGLLLNRASPTAILQL